LALIAFGDSSIFGITGSGSALLAIPPVAHLSSPAFALTMSSLLDCTNVWRIALAEPQSAMGRSGNARCR
jgi:uncharacterized membrane protein YfcA